MGSLRRLASRGLPELVCVSLLALVVAVVVVRAPRAFLDLAHRTRNAQATPLETKLLEGASGPGISTAFLAAARQRLPEDAEYAVITGPNAPTPTPVTLPWVTTFSRFWLFPRVQVPRAGAEWILCYGCDRSRLPDGTAVYEEDGGASSIVKVSRR